MSDPLMVIAARVSAWAVLFCAVASALVIAERWFILGRRRAGVMQLSGRLRTVLLRGEPAELESFCGEKSSPIMNTLRRFAALWRQDKGPRATSYDRAAAEELDRMERRLPLLATLAGLTPMLGILTVLVAYRDRLTGVPEPVMASAGPLDPLSTAGLALVTGAAALVFYNLFAVRVRSHLRDIERLGEELMPFLESLAGTNGGSAERAVPVFDDDEFFRKKAKPRTP